MLEKGMKGFYKSALRVAAGFVADVSTVHGANYLIRGSKTRTLLWTVFFIANFVLTSYLVRVVEVRFEKKRIYTQIDSTMRVSEVPFPSVMICNENLLSARQLRNIAHILEANGISLARRARFFSALPLLAQVTLDLSAVADDLDDILDILSGHYYDVDDIMFEVHQKCENLMLYCSFNREVRDCSKIFTMVKTMMGYCCAFNYGGVVSGGGGGADEEEKDSKNSDDYVGKEGFISTSESGRYSGLSVALNVEPDDYPAWSPARYFGAKIFINDPNDYPETTVHSRYVSVGQHLTLKVTPAMYVSDPQLRGLTALERNCWFDNEVKIAFRDRYSFESCCTECRMGLIARRCGCIPFYYPTFDKQTRYCTFGDLRCLRNLTVDDSVGPRETPYGCNCLPECSDKRYSLKTDLLPVNAQLLPEDVANRHTASNLSSVSVFYAKSTCTLYRKMLLMDWNDLIATYGGIFSLSVGASMITLVEFSFLLVQTCTKLLKNKGVL